MWFETKMAWRFLKSGKIQTLLILLGIIIGVTVQVFLGSLIQGLQIDLVDQTVGTAPHITVFANNQLPYSIIDEPKNSRAITFSGAEGSLNQWAVISQSLRAKREVTAVSPTTEGSGFAIRGQKRSSVVIRGVELEAADKIYNITDNIQSGIAKLGANNILIGTDLATEFELSSGDTLKITTAQGISDRFTVNGIFDLGSKELNQNWIIIGRRRAGSLFDLAGKASRIELQIEDVFTAENISREIMNQYPMIEAESWQQNNQQLLTALRSQGSSSLVIQVFVIIAVTLGISSVLAVSVVQKSKQIGILKAMGTAKKRVALIFLIQGFILGLIGSIIGSVTGIGLTKIFVNLVRDESGNPLFPIQVDLFFIMISITVATLAGMIAAVIPAINSAKLSPIEVIQNG
jgi:lipoprotein-releasing system permease protein